jgi:alpha-mannosidase
MNSEREIEEEAEEKPDEIYLVPHTHYDAICFLTKEDFFYVTIDLILKKVIDILDKTDDYKFTIEQTFLLEEVEKRLPELFSRMREYIKQGRIEIADGEYLMADTMLPQEETLVREILFGKNYIKEKFGVEVPVMWQVDRFGKNAQLPQIYTKSGYKWVVFRSGCPERNPSEFLWEGLDGTKIIAHWMPLGFITESDLNKLERIYLELRRISLTNHILIPYGGRITIPRSDTSEIVNEWNKKHRSRMKIATPSEFFKALEKEPVEMPIRRGEMFSGKYSDVFPDCSSSRIWVKKSLRRYESWLLSFERYVAILKILNFHEQYTEELRDFWKKILFMGFHNVIPGTSMDSAYEEVRDYIGFLKTKLSYLTPKVLKEVIDADLRKETYGDVVVFNPLSWDVSNWVEVDLNFDEGDVKKIGGLRSEDEEIDVEILRFTRYEDESLRYARIGFVANVPAAGYKVYKIMKGVPKGNGNFIRIKGNIIETKNFDVRFNSRNGLIDVIKNGIKVCRANELVLEEEIGDLYCHKETTGCPLKTEGGEGVRYGSFRMKNFWIEKSPVRRVIHIEVDYFSLRWPYRLVDTLRPMIWRHNFQKVRKKIIVYRDLPRIDFVTTVKEEHPRLRLRVRFSTEIFKIPEYCCDSQFGTVTRPTNQYYYEPEGWKEKPSGIFPSLRWVDYSNGKIGMTIINKGTPENEVREGSVYITLLRGVDMLSSDGMAGPAIPVPDARELKTYTFRYSLYPHEGDWRGAKSYKHGFEFNYDLVAMQLPRAKKFRVKRSFLKLEPDNIVMTALKPSEDGEGVILRFYEASGEETDARLVLFKKPEKAVKTNLIEEELEEITAGENIEIKVKPFEIVTIKLVF